MDTNEIENLIADRCDDPDAGDDLRELLQAVSDRHGVDPADEDLLRGARFIRAYIEQVPYMLKVAWTAACTVGLQTEMQGIIDVVKSYWLQDLDEIPDHLGIIGLLDDAYCSLTALQAVSDHYRLQSGKFLFPDDLTEANRAMREIIGEPYAGNLDALVLASLGDAGVVEAVKSLASPEKRTRFEQQATIWNHGPVATFSVDGLAGLGLDREPGIKPRG